MKRRLLVIIGVVAVGKGGLAAENNVTHQEFPFTQYGDIHADLTIGVVYYSAGVKSASWFSAGDRDAHIRATLIVNLLTSGLDFDPCVRRRSVLAGYSTDSHEGGSSSSGEMHKDRVVKSSPNPHAALQ